MRTVFEAWACGRAWEWCCRLAPAFHARDHRLKLELAAIVDVCLCSLRLQLLSKVWFCGFYRWIFGVNNLWPLPWISFVWKLHRVFGRQDWHCRLRVISKVVLSRFCFRLISVAIFRGTFELCRQTPAQPNFPPRVFRQPPLCSAVFSSRHCGKWSNLFGSGDCLNSNAL